MNKTIITLALCAASIASAQVSNPAALPLIAVAAESALAPKASTLLVFRYKWATLWDYGVTALPIDAFTEPAACDREAQQLEAEPHGEPIFLLKDGKLEPAPHFVCQVITTEDEQAWGKVLLAKKLIAPAEK